MPRILTDPGYAPLTKNQILSEKEYRELREKYEDDFDAGMGAEAVKKLLADINLEELSVQLRESSSTLRDRKKRPASSSAWRWWMPSACPATSREWMVI